MRVTDELLDMGWIERIRLIVLSARSRRVVLFTCMSL
jgi:hypothetical protein